MVGRSWGGGRGKRGKGEEGKGEEGKGRKGGEGKEGEGGRGEGGRRGKKGKGEGEGKEGEDSIRLTIKLVKRRMCKVEGIMSVLHLSSTHFSLATWLLAKRLGKLHRYAVVRSYLVLRAFLPAILTSK